MGSYSVQGKVITLLLLQLLVVLFVTISLTWLFKNKPAARSDKGRQFRYVIHRLMTCVFQKVRSLTQTLCNFLA